MSSHSPKTVLSQWDWPEGKEEGSPTGAGELLPPVARKSNVTELKPLPPYPSYPSKRSRELGCKVIQGALKRVDAARRTREGLYEAALALALGWRKWLGPHKLPIPILPVAGPIHTLDMEPREWDQVERRLKDLTSWLELMCLSHVEDTTALSDRCKQAADVFLAWLELVGLAHAAPSTSVPTVVGELPSDESPLIPYDERERSRVLLAREKRLWEQLRSYDWSPRGRTSYARARRGSAAFEAKMVGILTSQGEATLAKDAGRASRVYRDRADLAKGDREVRLTLLRLWAQTVCDLHQWPLPTFERAKPPSGSSSPAGSAWRGGRPGEPGSVFTIELKPPAGNFPDTGAEADSDVLDLPADWVPDDAPLPPLPPFEMEGEESDKSDLAPVPELIEVAGPDMLGEKLAIQPAVEQRDTDRSPVEEVAKEPLASKKPAPKAARVASGVRQARVSIQWFPSLMAVAMVGLVGCQHAQECVQPGDTRSHPGPGLRSDLVGQNQGYGLEHSQW